MFADILTDLSLEHYCYVTLPAVHFPASFALGASSAYTPFHSVAVWLLTLHFRPIRLTDWLLTLRFLPISLTVWLLTLHFLPINLTLRLLTLHFLPISLTVRLLTFALPPH
jgi:hypothetical protein